MSTNNRTIALYIHPDKGPVMPMELDMMAVQVAAMNVPAGPQRDDALYREIAKRICAQFPKVDPESNRSEIRSIMSRLSHFDIFNGVVLRLPGRIEVAATTSPAPPSKAIVADLKDLEDQVQQFKLQLNKEKAEHALTKARLYTQESENKRLLTALRAQGSQELASLQTQVQHDQETIERARTLVKHLRTELETAQREVAAVRTELEQTQGELQTNTGFVHEISTLRQQVMHAKKAEQQLNETLAQRDLKIDELRATIRQLTEEVPLAGETGMSNTFSGERYI